MCHDMIFNQCSYFTRLVRDRLGQDILWDMRAKVVTLSLMPAVLRDYLQLLLKNNLFDAGPRTPSPMSLEMVRRALPAPGMARRFK